MHADQVPFSSELILSNCLSGTRTCELWIKERATLAVRHTSPEMNETWLSCIFSYSHEPRWLIRRI